MPAVSYYVAVPRVRPRSFIGVAWLLLAIAVIARVGFVVATPHYVPNQDPGDYLRLGMAIARSGAYPDNDVWVTRRGCPRIPILPRTPCIAPPGAPGAYLVGQPSGWRPPGYPYALAAPELIARWTGADPLTMARAFQVLLGVLDVALTGLLARMLWGPRVGLFALGLAAVYVPFVLISGTLIGEPLFVALMLGAVCAVLRWRCRRNPPMLLAAGVLAGLSALTRSNGVVVVLAVALLVLTADGYRQALRRAPSALLLLAVAAVTVAPWTIRNAIVFGRFVPVSTEGGQTLLDTYNRTSMAERRQPGTSLVLQDVPIYSTLARETLAHPDPEVDAAMRHAAVKFAIAHPTYVATVFWHNALRLLDLAGLGFARSTYASIDLAGGAAVAGVITFYVVALLALAGALLRAARRPPAAFWLIPVLLALSTVLIIEQTPRFRTPIEPFILLLAALTLERLAVTATGKIQETRRPRTPRAHNATRRTDEAGAVSLHPSSARPSNPSGSDSLPANPGSLIVSLGPGRS